MLWWHWVAIGMVLAVLEMAGPGGFFIIFFGVGALVVGLLSLAGLAGPAWTQWLLFSAISVVSLLLFRRPLLAWMRRHEGPAQPIDRLEGEIAVPAEDIAPGAMGRAELRGSMWSARNAGATVLVRGQRCVVARVDGNITPPADILAAMEKQMRAEREKRAVILTSEGARDAAINTADGVKQEVIKASEARKQQQINEAEGQASAILAVATATAEGIRRVAEAIKVDGGFEAVQLRVAEQYITQFGQIVNASDSTLVLPTNLADVGSMISLATQMIQRHPGGSTPPAR